MTCKNCGKEVRDGIAFCPFCGASLKEEPVVAVEPEKASEPVVKKEVVKKEKKPINKKPFIIGGIAVAVIAVVVACVMLFAGRNIDKTIEKYMEAIREEDEELLLEIMFPKDARDDGEDWYADGAIDDLLEDMNEEVKSISVVNSVDADEKVSAMVDEIFDEAGVDIKYTELKIVNINIQDDLSIHYVNGERIEDKKEVSQMIAYKVGNKWYILPGVFEYCVDTWQSEDIQSAEEISTAIQSALCSEEVYNSFQPYYDVVIDLESDLEYLPESVQTAIMGYLNSVPEIQHTYDGATGFSFVVSSNGIVTVYISTETNPTEWQVYPTVESGYDYGVVDEIATEETPVNLEYSYVKLISEQSPIAGYWQSDRAGMYIGYNVSGGDEGFSVYLQSQDFYFTLLHSLEDFSYSGGTGNIKFKGNTEYNNAIFDIQVIDEDTLKLVYTDVKYMNDELVNGEYIFKRGEITKETLSQYEGNWIDGGDVFSNFGYYGNVKMLSYCDECGSIHDKDYVENEYNCYHSSKYVSLYDGKTLHYIFPHEGLSIEGVGDVCYVGDSYAIDGDMMQYDTYVHGGGGEEYVFFRDGSDEAKVAETLNAYQEYIDNDNNLSEYASAYSLFYLNDDSIPEAMVTDATDGRMTGYIMTYSDGKVEALSLVCACDVKFQEKQNKLYVYSSPSDGYYGSSFYSLDNGKFVETDRFNYMEEFGIPEDIITYQQNGNVVSEDVYNSELAEAEKNFDLDSSAYIITYSNLYQAYLNLGVTEYGYSLYHIEAMSYDNGVLYIRGDDGEEISYPVADDCVWEFDSPFSVVSTPITYEEIESDWQDCRSEYLEYGEELNYSVTAVVKDDQVVRVYTVHN